MRKPKRIDVVLRQLKKLWKKMPQQRLGQLLENFIFTEGHRGDLTSVRLFNQEDDETLKNIEREIKESEKCEKGN